MRIRRNWKGTRTRSRKMCTSDASARQSYSGRSRNTRYVLIVLHYIGQGLNLILLTLKQHVFLAIAQGSIAARRTRAGGGEAQERRGARRAKCDLGPHAGHGGGREADGRKGSAQGHPGCQRLVRQVWSGKRRELSLIDRLKNPQFCPISQIFTCFDFNLFRYLFLRNSQLRPVTSWRW